MNYHGKVPGADNPFDDGPSPEFRSKFPVKYFLIDFGFSVSFPDTIPSTECLVEPFSIGRETRAPEIDGTQRFDPFAADVYQAARLIYGCLHVCILCYSASLKDINHTSLPGGCCRYAQFPRIASRHDLLQTLKSCLRFGRSEPIPRYAATNSESSVTTYTRVGAHIISNDSYATLALAGGHSARRPHGICLQIFRFLSS